MDAQVSCRDGSWSKINANWVIWVRGSDVARPETPLNPKETSLMTHPNASMKMYDIKKMNKIFEKLLKYFKTILLKKTFISTTSLLLVKTQILIFSNINVSIKDTTL